jgi:erythromycin esterase-like protein
MRGARELARFPIDPSMRDNGMSQTLSEALAMRLADTKAVLWGHNGHITRGPMRWMGTTETACGGFQALPRDEKNKWWFHRYGHGAPPADTVGHTFTTAGIYDALIDFRHAPEGGPVRAWLNRDCGIRSWGGHSVPDDPDAAVEQGLGLAWTILSADYDGLLFLKQTTSAVPVDQERIWN